MKFNHYIQSIKSGSVYHGEYIDKLINWHLSEIDKSNEYYFNETEANRYISFIEVLRLTKGEWAGKNFKLENWQAFIVAMIFGWRIKANNTRRFTEVTINVPKKNGKTELAAALCLACAVLDNDYGFQIYMAATARDQARLCFETAKQMIKLTPELIEANIFEPLAHSIYCGMFGGAIKAISSEAGGIEGAGASVVIFDEEHLQPTNELRDNLRSGMAARQQPLFISISTAGSDKNKPYYNHLKVCKNILNGVAINDRHLVVIYAADEKADWENPKTWQQANPNYGISVREDFLKQQYTDAKNEPFKQPNFITKHLNIWADSESTWIDSKHWLSLAHNKQLEEFEGNEIYIGLDLGTTGDFSAAIILIVEDDKFYFFTRFWIPDDMAGKRTKIDQLNFRQYARQGYITLTDGNATDYNQIEHDIVELSKRFEIKSLAYDKAFASMLVTRLTNDYDITCNPISQSATALTEPTKKLHELIMDKKIYHDNNPVMAWMVGNVQIYLNDANNNMKVHKGKSKNKVDGVSALVNAIADYMIDYNNNYNNNAEPVWLTM